MAQQTRDPRQDLYDITLTINGTDGTTFKHVFDTFKGGATTAKETKYRPANGTKAQVSIGGATEVGNVTVSRLNDGKVADKWIWLRNQVGKATGSVTKQPLDSNGVPFGDAENYGGRLNAVTPSETSSESDTPDMLEVELSAVTVS